MRAVVVEGYGSADKLKFVQDFPEPGPPVKHEVKIRVHAAAANAADYKVREGYVQSFMKLAPFPLVLGADCAGTVVAVGPKVKSVKVGDEVYGQTALVQRGRDGSHAEYAVVYDTNWELALKPSSMSFEEAAALPCAGITALACLRQYGKLKPGERVFVLGGSGGVGHFAVQLAKALGASFIAATCSSKNMEMVMGFGADVVYDYNATKEELALAEVKPDLIIDCVRGPEAWKAVQLARLPATTRFVTVIGEFGDAHVSLGGLLKFMSLIAWRGLRHSLGVAPAYLMVMGQEKENLRDLNALFEDKKLRPHIDRVVPLEKVKEVHELLQSHRARGKIVIKM